ncbi:MAG: calcium/sodium antiporter [Bacteroidales bacterium]|nr:calcium/sodium antiporter [Bacteroidales bacterium]MBP5689423.1 calcium/sodium antiporter [Bacteroidales bacterium]
MALTLLILIVGLALIVLGADWLVDGASSIARKAGISEFVIGLTIVGFGTSCPELVVSLTGAIAGSSDISAGNVIGSNIFNTLLILGLTAIVAPITITPKNKRRDIPMTIGVTVLFLLCGMSHTLFGLGGYDGISRIEGIVFLILFCAYIYLCFKTGSADEAEEGGKQMKLAAAIALVLAGLAGLIAGGKLFVNSATEIAQRLGISEKFIAVTILAGGTSLPELATCVVAAAKKKGQLALGNILGSNIFNILLILGCSAVVHPLHFAGINLVDMGVLLLSSLLVFTSAYTGRKDMVDRFDGSILLLCEVAYMAWLIYNL